MASALAPSVVPLGRELGKEIVGVGAGEMVSSEEEEEALLSPKKSEDSSEEDGVEAEVEPRAEAEDSEKSEGEVEERTKAESGQLESEVVQAAKERAPAPGGAPPQKEKKGKNGEDGMAESKSMGVGGLKEDVRGLGLGEEGKRERKQVERFSMPTPNKSEEKPAFAVVDGHGTKLNDIPFIADKINKKRGVDLKNVYRLCFGRTGKDHEIKKHLRLFSGLSFTKDSPEFAKKRGVVIKWKGAVLREVCEVLGVKKGTVEQMTDRLLDFSINPHDSGQLPKVKQVKSVKGKKSTSSPKKRSKKLPTPTTSTSTSKSKKGKKKKGESEDEDGSEGEGVEVESGEEQLLLKKSSASPLKKKGKVEKKKVVVERTPRESLRSGPSRQASAGKVYKEDEDENEFDEVLVPSDSKSKSKLGDGKSSAKAKVKAKAPKKDPPPAPPTHSDAEEEKEDDESESEEERRSRKRKRGGGGGGKKNTKSTPPASKGKGKVRVEVEEKESEEERGASDSASSGSEDEDEDSPAPPVKKRGKNIPSEDELRKVVEEIVKNSDLTKLTMKMVLEKVGEEYPGVDLESKKTFLKGIVKNLL